MSVERHPIEPFLADSCWYAITARMDNESLLSLAEQRREEGFTAIQLFVGVPSEIGPSNSNAESERGFPWTKKDGNLVPNIEYLEMARDKIEAINKLGLGVIVYGAVGYQIEWAGEEGMNSWWDGIINYLNDLNVIYCLTSESDHSIGEEWKLFPDISYGERVTTKGRTKIPDPVRFILAARLRPLFYNLVRRNELKVRREKWSKVLAHVGGKTDKPLLIHPIPGFTSHEAVSNPELLSAVTTYTGHFPQSKPSLWKIPKGLRRQYPGVPYINLEPYYEGIKNKFWLEDQIFAFWASMLSGALAYCYGAHGIWNVDTGDGFLNYWGPQNFDQARALKTPEILGKSFRKLNDFLGGERISAYILNRAANELIEIGMRTKSGKRVSYYPNRSRVIVPPGLRINPLTCERIVRVDSLPERNPLVVFQS